MKLALSTLDSARLRLPAMETRWHIRRLQGVKKKRQQHFNLIYY